MNFSFPKFSISNKFANTHVFANVKRERGFWTTLCPNNLAVNIHVS